MPITYLDEEEEDFASPLRPTPLTQPRRKITYLDEEPAGQQVGLLPPIEEMFKPKPKPAGDGFLRQAADIPVGLAKGAAQGVRSFTDILGADNPVSQSIRGVEDYLGNLMSAQAKEDQAEIARIMQDAQDKGVLDQVMAGIKAFSVAPVDMTVQALGTMAPVIVGGLAANTAKLAVTGIRGGAAAARGLTAGQMAATQAGIGAGMGAGVVKGTIYDDVKNELISQGLSEDAAHQQAVKAQEYGGKNLDQILLGAGLGAAAATTGAERIIGGILTKTGVGASKSRIGNALKAGVTEAFPEAAQGAQEQLAANLALQREGMEVPTTRGVFSAGALEGIAGFGVGAPIGAIQKASVAEDAAIKAEEANAPQTAAAIRAAGQKAAAEEKDISATEQAIEETEAAMRPTVPIGEEFVMPPKEEFKASYAKLTPESLAETEASFQEQLQDEDADTRAFAQTALEALAEFKAEQTPIPPTPARRRELPTDVLPTETPAATYGREAEIYDVFAGVRQRPLPPSGPAFESAQVIEQELARAERLRQSPEGRAQLRSELQGEQMTGEVRRAVEQALATTPEVVEEGDVFAEVRRPTDVAPAEPAAPVEPTPVAPAEVETAASLSRVADNTATDEEVVRLARQGLVNIQDGQNVITPRGEEVMQRGGAPLPRLTPEERAAEVAAAPAIVEQASPVAEAPAVTPAPVAEVPVAALEPREQTVDLGDNIKADFIGQGDVIIKDKDGERVGRFESSSMENGLQAINVTFLEEDYRGKGIGQKVVKKLRDIYGAIASDVTSDMSKSAKSMWINAGAKIEQITEGEDIQSRYVLRKEQPAVAAAPAPTPVTTPPVTEAVTPAPEVAPALAVTERPRIEAESPATTELRNKIKQTKGQDRRSVIQLAINDRSFFPAAIDAAEVGKPLPSIEKAFVPNDVELPDRIDTTRIKLPAIKSKSPEESASQMISYDDKRWVLGGVYFDSTNNMIVATDGRALVAIPQKITGGDKIVAARNIKETTYQKAIKKGQRIDGNYPNWKATIPTYGKDIQKVDIDIDDARRASTILESINNTFSNKIGESVIVFNNARFNPKYILSSINALLESGAKSITAQIRSEADPLLLTGDNGAIAVVMPMRVTGRIAHQLKSKTETRPPVKKYNTQALLNAAKPFSEYGSNYNRNIAASYERLKNAIDKGLSESTTSSIAEELEIRLNKFQPEALTSPTPAVPVAEPAGISVGNRVKTKTTPQSFVVEEVLPQSAREAELGEQYYSIRNERTGEVQTVEANDIQPIKAKKPPLPKKQTRGGTTTFDFTPRAALPTDQQLDKDTIIARAQEAFEGVPAGRIEVVNDPAPEGSYGYIAAYNPNTNKIEINQAYYTLEDNIGERISHELGHYLYQDPRWQKAFARLYKRLTPKSRQKLDAFIEQAYSDYESGDRNEEANVRAFDRFLNDAKDNRNIFRKFLDEILDFITDALSIFSPYFKTLARNPRRLANNIAVIAAERFKSGEAIEGVDTTIAPEERKFAREAAEPTPAPEAVVEEAPAERVTRRTKMQNIIDISTGVKRPRTKLTVDEMAALKNQIKIGARKRREDKQTQKEFAKDVTEYLRGMAIRGKVSAPQLRAITSKAMQTQFDNEASIKSFINYANKVIENANYNKDISEAKAAIKRARQLADQKKGSPQTKAILASFGVVDPKEIEPENMDERDVEVDGVIVREKPISVAEFTSVLKEYMKAFAPVTAEGYVVIPDAEMVDFLSKVGAQIKQNQDATKNIGFDGELAEIADKTPRQIEEELARDEERRKRIENKVNKLAEAAQIGLAKYDNPDLNVDEKDILDFMKRATLSDMDLGNRKDYIRIANDILVNNKFFGAEKFASIAEGQIGAAEAARDSKTIKRNDALIKGYYQLFGEETGREIALGMQSLSDTLRNITRPEEGVRLLYQMGFGKLERGRAAANSEKRKFTDAMDVRLKQIEKKTGQSINDGQGLISSGVAATLIQTAPDETQAEGIQRMRGLIEADIERKKNSWRKEDRMTAALVEQALKEVYADSVDGILANLKKTHPANYEVLTFLMDTVLPSYKPLFKQHDEMFNNQTDNYDNPFYLPIKYRRVVTEPVDPAEGIGNRMQSVASPKQSVNSIKRVKNTVLPENMQFDYNLIRNVIDSVASQLDAVYMNPGLQQVHAFLTSENAAKALGGAENLEIVRRRINSLAESRDRKSYDMTGWSRVFDTLANGVRNISTTMLLGGIGQVAKQAPAQMLATVINVNDASITGTAAFEIKAALPVMQQFSIGERGEIAGGARWINQLDTGYSKLERYIESGLWSKVKDVAQNLGDVWLAALKKSDSVAAGHGWISYYKKYLKDNNIPFTNWDNEARLVAEGDRDRVQAGLYADTQIDIYQGASDPTKMATFAQRGKSGAENMMKTIFLPFSSFAIQERTRFLSDLRDATYGSTEEKKRAAKGLASTIAGIATFHWVRRYVLPFFFGYLAYGLYGMLGVEMEEPDEEKEKEMKDRTFKKFLGELAANITVGGYSSLAENAMIDAVNMMAYEYDKLNENENVMTEDGEIMSWETYQKKRAPFYRYTGPGADTSLGMFDVIPDQLKSVKDKLADLSDEELMDSLTEEEKRVLILAGFSDILYTLRLNDTDVARMINKMSKDVKALAEEREKEQRKLMRMFQ